MRRSIPIIMFLVGITFLLLAAQDARADTIHKTDGGLVKGKIVEETSEYVRIKTKYGTLKIDKYDIDSIERGDADEAEPEDKQPEKVEPEKAEIPETEKPVVEKNKPVQPEEPDKVVQKEPKSNDKLLSQENLDKLKKICKKRMKAYEGIPWDKAWQFNTKHFDIKCNSSQEVAKHYAWLLEKLYSKYADVFAAFNPKNIRCRIEIYRNYTEFRQLKGVSPGVGGFYQPGRHVLCAFHGRMGTMTTDGILSHEGCHLFQDLFLPSFQFAPIWVLEGMATLMEAAKIEKDGKIHIRGVSPDRLSHLQNMIKGGSSFPLSQVMSTPQSQFRAEHYAHAGMLTFWLIKGANKKSCVYLYNDYLKIAAGGTSSTGENIRAHAIRQGDFERMCDQRGTSLSKLEEQWKKWVLKQVVERPGKVVGRKFVCDDYGFEISTPGPGWKIETEDTHGALCVMTHKKIKGRIAISVGGTFGTPNLDEFLSMVDQMREKSLSKLQNYRRIGRERRKFYQNTLDGWDTVSEYADPESPITKEFQRRRGVSFSMVDTLYSFGCNADPDKFDEFNKYFQQVLDSFRLDADKID